MLSVPTKRIDDLNLETSSERDERIKSDRSEVTPHGRLPSEGDLRQLAALSRWGISASSSRLRCNGATVASKSVDPAGRVPDRPFAQLRSSATLWLVQTGQCRLSAQVPEESTLGR